MLLACTVLSLSTYALEPIPDCSGALNINNEDVLKWKTSTPNQFKARGHIEGTLQKTFKDKTGHKHWEIRIGDKSKDLIELIYNEDFGRLPESYIGMKIEACGDYITSNKPTGNLPASPDGAIIHWVHISSTPKHPSGFVVVDGTVYGQHEQQ